MEEQVVEVMEVVDVAQCTIEIVYTEEGTFNFWTQGLTEHRKSS